METGGDTGVRDRWWDAMSDMDVLSTLHYASADQIEVSEDDGDHWCVFVGMDGERASFNLAALDGTCGVRDIIAAAINMGRADVLLHQRQGSPAE